MNTTNAVKKTQGRRKIAIKPIDNQNSRHVTFSKRRLGLFKKASELCILSGAEIAILVQSLKRQRLFTFGHPSADAVIDRYLTGKSSSSSTNDQLNMQQNNQYYSQLCRELETEKKKKESIEELKLVNNDGSDNNGEFWWNEPIDDMGIEELEEFMTALGELKKKVTMRADELNMINGSSSSNSTMQIARFGAEDHFLNQQAIDYCSSIVPYDFNQPGDGQF
ncbi:agamous-like MADS-box protein AGL62 [Lycium ferocissimum]|uniref:agamous-like MADS-box protein AGL62 n=1 Tax=Lycium ferocissimum TaxID=112874 RepID=UPI00281573A0|nr:agamous-like MADS-box protein AGL62 [Lycium ferocissimum]